MGILCVDIGGGTQDICFYTGADSFENSLKMVLHTPSKHICTAIEKIEGDLFVSGGVIGGGNLSKVLSSKIKNGNRVYMAQSAAPSVRDNMDYVKNLGITLVEDVINPNVILDEFDYHIFKPVITTTYGETAVDTVAIAAQDHGYIPNQSDRVTRFDFLKQFLKNGLGQAFYSNIEDIPNNFTRWRSLGLSVKEKCPNSKLHLSDTGVIAALGAVYGEDIRPIITVDVGNCHTFAALLGEGNKVLSFFEHHTHVLTPESLWNLIERLSKSEIDGKEIFDNDGHGAYIFEKVNAAQCPILVTGPNRDKYLKEGGRVKFAYPKGDTMMAGPVGLLTQIGVTF